MRQLIVCLALVLSACDQLEQAVDDFAVAASRLPNYDEARRVFWRQVYADGGSTLYCGREFRSRQNGLNIEHVFPMSWVSNALDCGKRKQCRQRSTMFNRIEADLHNLYPSREDVNYARSSFRFGEINGERRDFGRSCDFEVQPYKRVAEVRPDARGDVARAMFYMVDEYADQGLELYRKQAELLYRWHQSDPPDASERQRNDRIERIQGNRNRFIDNPALLTRPR